MAASRRISSSWIVPAVAGAFALVVSACADGFTPTAPSASTVGSSSGSISRTSANSEMQVAAVAATSTAHTTIPVAFGFASGTCGLTTHVAATGELDMKVHSVAAPTGTVRVTINTQARGTATGDDGSRYMFSYNQTLIQENAATDPIPVRATDVFQLIGLGDAPNVHSGFVATADLSGGQLSNVTFKIIRGNPFGCDPL